MRSQDEPPLLISSAFHAHQGLPLDCMPTLEQELEDSHATSGAERAIVVAFLASPGRGTGEATRLTHSDRIGVICDGARPRSPWTSMRWKSKPDAAPR